MRAWITALAAMLLLAAGVACGGDEPQGQGPEPGGPNAPAIAEAENLDAIRAELLARLDAAGWAWNEEFDRVERTIDGQRCSSHILFNPGSVALYAGAGESVVTDPQRRVGARVSGDRAACVRALDEVFSAFDVEQVLIDAGPEPEPGSPLHEELHGD